MLEKRQSGKHGWGVFALCDIKGGEFVCSMLEGQFFQAHEINDDMYVMQIACDLYIGTAEQGDHLAIENFLNHSCKPNLGFAHGTPKLYALRDIKKDEEMTWDYSASMDEDGWRIKCGCEAEKCRGEISSFRYLSKEQKAKIIPYSLNYLREIYAESEQR